MKTKYLAALLLALCVTAPGLAQDVELPGFLKFVKVNPGVNIRKAPSTTSLRLMSYYDKEYEGGESDGSWIEWENAKQRRYVQGPVHASLVPVVNEEGDWYKIYYSSGIHWGGSSFCDYAYVAKRFCTDAELTTVPFESSPKATGKYRNYSYSMDDGGGDLVPTLRRHFGLFNAEMELKDWELARLDDYYEGLTNAQLQRVIPAFSSKVTAIEVKAKGDKYSTTILLGNYKGELRTVSEDNATLTPDSYKENKAKGELFLAENKTKPGVKVLPSGVQYKVIKQGTGRKPTLNTQATVHYEMRLTDGTVVDSSYKRGKTATFKPSQTVTGFKEALLNMPVGSVWEVYVPQELGYGEMKTGPIEPFSTTIYKIELISLDR